MSDENNNESNGGPNGTVRQVLPYNFRFLLTGKMVIENTRGQSLIVSKGEVQRILQHDDLDVHRRRMYEAALAEFDKEEEKVQ